MKQKHMAYDCASNKARAVISSDPSVSDGQARARCPASIKD